MQETSQTSVLKAMGPAGRWRVATALYSEARAWKAAATRSLHPDWSEDRIAQTVRKAFLHGYAA
jgi:hypothetical protein